MFDTSTQHEVNEYEVILFKLPIQPDNNLVGASLTPNSFNELSVSFELAALSEGMYKMVLTPGKTENPIAPIEFYLELKKSEVPK